MSKFFATASRGTEDVLAEEIREIGISAVEIGRGGVAFGRRLEDAYRVCLWSRVASRVLYPLRRFEAGDARALYDGVRTIDWTAHVGPEKTLAVDVAGKQSPAGPPHFLALKTKDAIVDRVRDAEGARPSVDTRRPDVRINVHVAGTRVTVGLDMAGRGLHRRGFGRAGAEAPLKENLAAALLRLAGWPARCADTPLFDPFCGSGTLLLEAAWMALDVAPGLERQRFDRHLGAEGWRSHDAGLWSRLLSEARQRKHAARERSRRIFGSDASRAALRTLQRNLEQAGLAGKIRVESRALGDVEPPVEDAGIVVTNPPYGARLGEAGELGPLYQTLGDVLKRRFPGWTAWVLSGNPALAKRIGLRPASRHVLYNGPIECRLLEIPISETPVTGDRGPGWRKPSEGAEPFAKKLRKNRRRLAKWIKYHHLTCYRLYDSDMPIYNLAVDWYDGAVRVEEYERPRKVPAEVAEQRLQDALLVIPEALGVTPDDVILRVRRKRAPGEQEKKRGDARHFREVREGDLRFLVNLEDYLDTGLFLDDRMLRRRILKQAKDKDFLNLFAYTCTASVAAAIGGARSTTSVDLSRVYLDWGRRNFALNGIDLDQPSGFDHRTVRTDVLQWFGRGKHGIFDLIFVAPPTWSRSKAMDQDFDVQRDHIRLLERCRALLAPGGEILFTTNARDFVFEAKRLRGLKAEEITAEITPLDFERRPRLRAWSLKKSS